MPGHLSERLILLQVHRDDVPFQSKEIGRKNEGAPPCIERRHEKGLKRKYEMEELKNCGGSSSKLLVSQVLDGKGRGGHVTMARREELHGHR